MASARTTLIFPLALAVALSTFAVSVDLHNSEPQAAALVLLAGGFVLGACWPERAWRWAVILGLSILIGDNAAPRLGLINRDVEPMNWGTLLGLIPAFVGTYAGVGARALFGAAVKSV